MATRHTEADSKFVSRGAVQLVQMTEHRGEISKRSQNRVEAPGIEPRDRSVPIVAKRREDDADRATQHDARRREVWLRRL